ncbi:MAG: glycerol acyltransferase [Anaerolineales bacterium]|nr:glycerol acyltransferase [Anaerolineales bacterium]
MTQSQLDTLTQINLDDLVSSFGAQKNPLLARTLKRIFYSYARKFAQNMTDFDVEVGSHGLADGARLVLRRHFRDLRVHGADLIPASDFLALSNHPGLSDSVAAFAALNRPDLKVIALQRPFLEALINVSKQLFYVTDDSSSRMTLVRQVSAFLRNGGAVLTYPAGHIEPDPDAHSDAVDSLSAWTDSVGVFIRMSPETPILPVLVRGAVWTKALHHPLTRLRKTRIEREALAAAYQVFHHMRGVIEGVNVRVQVGNPIYAKNLGSTETRVIHRAVLAEMTRLIENPPMDEGEPLL